jgi:hypothetical protein
MLFGDETLALSGLSRFKRLLGYPVGTIETILSKNNVLKRKFFAQNYDRPSFNKTL